MEAKKTKKADIGNRRVLFFETGLVVSLVAVVSAFAWGSSEKSVVPVAEPLPPPAPQVMVNTDQKPPPPKVNPAPVKFFSEIIEVARNDDPIDDGGWRFFEPDEPFTVPQSLPEEVVDDVPFYFAEQMPSFEGGGLESFRNWVTERLQYPRVALENGIRGRVTLRFVIERDGSLTGVETINSPHTSLSAEAARVLALSPKWSPGKQRGKAVRVVYVLPVEFALQGD